MTFLWLALACLLSLGMLVALDILVSLKRTGWRRFVSLLLLFYAQIIGTEFLLGALSWLYGYSLALLNIALTAALVIALRKRHGSRLFKAYLKNLQALPGVLKTSVRQDASLRVMGLLASAFLVWVLFLGLIFPPLDWDGNAYHLTYAADLVQNHNIYDVPANIVWIPGYPKGGEFAQAWTLLLAHNDTLVDLSQVPFAMLAIGALYGIARTLGVSKKSARYAALLFAFTPSVLNQLTTGYIDIMLCAVFFAALALVLQKTYDKLDLLLIGITFSLLIAIKSSGLYFVVMLSLILGWNLYKQRGRSLKQYTAPVLLVVSPMVFGLYWYVKNLVLYGSPIYPFGFQIAGKTVFKGINFATWSSGVSASLPHSVFLRLWYTWSERITNQTFVYNYDSSYFGFGPIWFIVLVPAMLLSIYFAIKNRLYYFLVVLALMLGLLLAYPTDFSPRYTMFIVSAGVVGFGIVLDNLHVATAKIVKLALLVLAVVTLGVNFVLWSYRPHTVKEQLSSIISGRGEHAVGTIYQTNFGNAYVWIHNNIRAGQTVVYTAGYWVYPLWNDTFSDRVVYVNASTESAWYRQVTAQKPTYIFITTDTRSQENKWAMDKFKNVIYDDGWYEIFKVN